MRGLRIGPGLVVGVALSAFAWALSENMWLTLLCVYAFLLYQQRRLDPHE